MEKPHPRFDEPLRLVHHHPGRLRLRVNAFIGKMDDHPAVRAARRVAERDKGVRGFSYNASTGSIVIEYRPGGLDVDALLLRIAAAAGLRGVIDDKLDRVHRDELVRILLDAVQGMNSLAHEVSGGRVDLREALPAALALLSVWSLVVNEDGARLPRWDNALFWCQTLFVEWHRKEIACRNGDGAEGGSHAEPAAAGVSRRAVSGANHRS